MGRQSTTSIMVEKLECSCRVSHFSSAWNNSECVRRCQICYGGNERSIWRAGRMEIRVLHKKIRISARVHG